MKASLRDWELLREVIRLAQDDGARRLIPAAVLPEYERLRRLERAQAPSFAEVLLAIPQDDGEFPRRDVRPRDLEV